MPTRPNGHDSRSHSLVPPCRRGAHSPSPPRGRSRTPLLWRLIPVCLAGLSRRATLLRPRCTRRAPPVAPNGISGLTNLAETPPLALRASIEPYAHFHAPETVAPPTENSPVPPPSPRGFAKCYTPVMAETDTLAKAETHTPAPAADRRTPTTVKKYQRISVDAKLKVLELSVDGVKNADIARITGLSEQRISDIVNTHSQLRDRVKAVLDGHRLKAAAAWGQAIPKAAKKGDHRPARELLIATGDVNPLESAGSGVQVIVNMPGPGASEGAKVAGSASTLDSVFALPDAKS